MDFPFRNVLPAEDNEDEIFIFKRAFRKARGEPRFGPGNLLFDADGSPVAASG